MHITGFNPEDPMRLFSWDLRYRPAEFTLTTFSQVQIHNGLYCFSFQSNSVFHYNAQVRNALHVYCDGFDWPPTERRWYQRCSDVKRIDWVFAASMFSEAFEKSRFNQTAVFRQQMSQICMIQSELLQALFKLARNARRRWTPVCIQTAFPIFFFFPEQRRAKNKPGI